MVRCKNIALMFAWYGVIFLTMAAVSIMVHAGHLETIPVSHLVPTSQFQVVIRNCCGHGVCIKERHHEEIQWQYLAAKN